MPLTDDEQRRAATLVHLALAELATQRRTAQVLRELRVASRTCIHLAREGVGPEAYAIGSAAVDTLASDEPDLEVLRLMAEVLEQQFRMATRGQAFVAMGAAIVETR